MSALELIVTLSVTCVILLFDLVVIARQPREPTTRQCAIALSAYIGLAVVFGIWVWCFHGQRFGLQFLAGWLTEYSLSVDNLFVFIVLIANFGVPRIYQQRVLLVGIVLALVFRGVCIALGAAAIQRFSWVFYVFGAFLVYTAVKLARGAGDDAGGPNAVVRFAANRLGATDDWDARKLYAKKGSKRVAVWASPTSIVILALGATDLMFALDSIPAIYGLTREAYLVFAANVFALMGMRQLYFLLGGLLDRLVYLSKGLALVLLFIGAKLVLHALHENDVPFINGGQHVDVPKISTSVSLVVIVVTLVITAVASLYATRVADAEDRASR